MRAVFRIMTTNALVHRVKRCVDVRIIYVGKRWPVAAFAADADQRHRFGPRFETARQAEGGGVALLAVGIDFESLIGQ